MKLNNKGMAEAVLAFWLFSVILVGTVHFTKYASGEWGKNGSQSIHTCYETGSCWYQDKRFNP